MRSFCTIGSFRCRVQYPGPSQDRFPVRRLRGLVALGSLLLFPLAVWPLSAGAAAAAAPVSSLPLLPSAAPLPDAGASVLRLLGALVFVVAVFLVAVWGLRRWQRAGSIGRKGPRLTILDVQSLGGRQALYVVAYDRQRFLVGSSPTGVALLTQLPEGESEAEGPSAQASFASALHQVLSRKAS